MTCAALITAAGYGKRMRADRPKQYLDLAGAPVVVWTLRAFEQHPLIDLIVLTAPPGAEELCRSQIVAPYKLTKIKGVVTGGETRQQSVLNGLETLEDAEIVAIHDGVRPLVSSEVITGTIEAAKTGGAALACAPVRDTVKKRDGRYLSTVSRSDLWLAHTPQTFRTGLILDAHRRAVQDGYAGTDDASLVERLGLPVEVIEDSGYNIKITSPEDLRLAELLLRA
jgi:2-C-methyl-D-erythritol 4-phosphate cytidylyltransferase